MCSRRGKGAEEVLRVGWHVVVGLAQRRRGVVGTILIAFVPFRFLSDLVVMAVMVA